MKQIEQRIYRTFKHGGPPLSKQKIEVFFKIPRFFAEKPLKLTQYFRGRKMRILYNLNRKRKRKQAEKLHFNRMHKTHAPSLFRMLKNVFQKSEVFRWFWRELYTISHPVSLLNFAVSLQYLAVRPQRSHRDFSPGRKKRAGRADD
ncbi:MAG: hypothetical protein ACI4PD_01720 [Butyricicoccus sp.]